MTNNKANYIPYLDGMRGLAIIFVILSHIGLGRFVPGGFGVSLFFFISGFLITKLLIAEYDETQTISLKKFYLRRLFRLYPALLAMIALTVIIILVFDGRDTQIHLMAVGSSLFYFYNYYYAYLKPPPANSFDNLFNITWSLSIEEHFYLVFPVLFCWLYNKKNILLKVLVFICVLTLAYRFYLLYRSADVAATMKIIYVLTETRVDSIIWGCIAALLIYKNHNQYYIGLLKSNRAFILGVLIIASSFLFKHSLIIEAGRFTKQSLAFFLMVPAVYYCTATSWVRRFFESNVLIFTGKISYSLYLFHWKAITLADEYFNGGGYQWVIFALGLTIILSLASYYFVELPFIALRKKFGSHAR